MDIRAILKKYNSLSGVIIIASIFIILLSLVKSYHFTQTYGGCDGRARLIGARLLEAGKDPYFYKWKQEDGVYFCDPNDQEGRIINGVTSTPFLLKIIAPLIKMPYPKSRLLWTMASFIFLGISIACIITHKRNLTNYIVPIIGITALFISSSIWFIHIERGQIYILFLLLLSLFYFLLNSSNKYLLLLAGTILALAIFFRPTFIFLCIPLVFFKKYITLLGTALSIIIIGFFSVKNINSWEQYSYAMKYYGNELNMSDSSYKKPNTPNIIEGAVNVTNIKQDFYAGGIDPIMYKVFYEKYVKHINLIGVFISGILLLFFLLLMKKQRKTFDSIQLGLLLFLAYVLPELIMPTPRGAYNLVLYMFPFMLLAANDRLSKIEMVIALIGWLFMQSIPFYFSLNYWLGELLLLVLIISKAISIKKQIA